MASENIVIRVKPHTKWAARRAAKAEKITLTDYIVRLIHQDQINRDSQGKLILSIAEDFVGAVTGKQARRP